jgi:hypothetical protein
MASQLRQQVFSKAVGWLAALSFFLPPLDAPCRCGEHTVVTADSSQNTVEQTIRPSCCGQRKHAGTSRTHSCCSAGTELSDLGRCCKDLKSQPAACCRADAVTVTKHAGACTCGERCVCGSREPSKPPAAPAASPPRATERAPVVGHAVAPLPAFCLAPAGYSAEEASLVPRVAACGLCVQFCHLTI